jgi:hypothetical protein
MGGNRTTMENIAERLHLIDDMIQKEETGSPKEMAKKLGISLRLMYWYLELLKKLEAPIQYDYKRRTYYYSQKGMFVMSFLPDTAVMRERLKKPDWNASPSQSEPGSEWSWQN